MNQKQIGGVLIIVGFILAILVLLIKIQIDDVVIEQHIESHDTCITPEGKCLHRQSMTYVFLGWALSFAVFMLGVYLYFFDKTQQQLTEQNFMIAQALKEAKQKSTSQEKFDSFLAGFTLDEQKVLKAVHDQDGILQSTLRFRTDLSKATLSHILTHLEEKNIIARKIKGKSKEVFLKKKF